MARKKRPAFDGSAQREKETVKAARSLATLADAFADLDDVRKWVRDGQGLLRRALDRFSAAREEAGSDALFDLQAIMTSATVRDAPDPGNWIIGLLAEAEDVVERLAAQLPTTSNVDGIDAADELLRGLVTVEESAIALGMSEGAIERRRNRRKQ